jgi:WD40 repeat protein
MEDLNTLKKQGDALYVHGHYEEAVESYTLAIDQVNADKVNADGNQDVCTQSALHSNRCMSYLKLNQLSDAWQDAQKCLSLRPRWSKAHLRCAQCQELQGASEEAIVYYQRAAELDISLAEEVIEPIQRIQAELAQKLCYSTILPPTQSSINNGNNLKPPPPIYYASLCPRTIRSGTQDTNILAAAYGDGAIRLWCTTTGNLISTLQEVDIGVHSQAVTTLVWNADGTMLASGSLDMTCAIWKLGLSKNIKDGVDNSFLNFELLSILKGHSGRVSAVRFAPFLGENNNKKEYHSHVAVITASTDLSIKVWKVNDSSTSPNSFAECLYTLGGHSSLVSHIDVDRIDHKILVSASGDAQFKLWDLEKKGQLLENVAWESDPVVLCGFLPSPLLLLLTAHAQLARQEGRILLWDVLGKKDGWVDGNLAAPAWSLDGFVGRPTSWDACCYCSTKKAEEENPVLLAVACSDGSVRVWEILNKNTRPFELFGFLITKYSNGGNNDPPPWHAATLAQQSTPGNAFNVKFSPHGRFLAATGGSANEIISIWNVQQGEQVCILPGHSGRIRSLEWSKDDNYLFSASEDGAIKKWQVGKTEKS